MFSENFECCFSGAVTVPIKRCGQTDVLILGVYSFFYRQRAKGATFM